MTQSILVVRVVLLGPLRDRSSIGVSGTAKCKVMFVCVILYVSCLYICITYKWTMDDVDNLSGRVVVCNPDASWPIEEK